MRIPALLRLVVVFATASVAARGQATGAAPRASGPAQTAGSSAPAASAATSAPAVPQVNVTFKTEALNTPVQGVYFHSGNQTLQLSAQPFTASQATYTYSGNATMQLLARDSAAAAPSADTTAASGSGQGRGGRRGGAGGLPPGTSVKSVGSITFPKSGTYIVYLAGNSESGVSGVALSANTNDFPVGSMRFINGTTLPMSIQFGDDPNVKPVQLKAYDAYVYKFTSQDPIYATIFRNDADQPAALQGMTIAPPAPGVRTSFFIILTNRQDMLDNGAAPKIDVSQVSETPGANQAGPGRQGGPPRGGTGGPAGSGGTGRRRGTNGPGGSGYGTGG